VAYPSGEARAITVGATDYRNPSLSSDGKILVAVAAQRLSTVSIVRAADGASLRTVSATQRDGAGGVAFTADGHIVYTSNLGDSIELWSCDGDGANRQQITTRNSLLRDPVVTRDGRVVFVAYDNGAVAVWRVNLDGSGLMRLSPATIGSTPAVSPDGRTVYFDADFGQGRLLYLIPTDGGTAIRVTNFPVAAPTISPDGHTIAAIVWIGTDIPRLGLIDPLTGRLLRRIGDPVNADNINNNLYRFSPDGKTIYYNVNSNVMNIDLATEKVRVALRYEPLEGVPQFAVGSDGTLLVAHGLFTRDAWQITGFEQ
jgi:Tol biopolymer transport system component